MMGLQRFYASPRDTFTWPNGAVGHRPGGPMDCLGPYAKVENCPIACTLIRRTVYATNYPDTMWSVPAACKVRGRVLRGVLIIVDGENVVFSPYAQYHDFIRPEIEACLAEQRVREGT